MEDIVGKYIKQLHEPNHRFKSWEHCFMAFSDFKIIKFEGCYHGHSDALLVKAGSGVMTAGVPDSSGVPAGATEDTLLAPYNDLEAVERLFDT